MEGSISNLPSTRIAVVTGGNKGIGLEVCRQLAGAGVTVVLTARDETRGAAAIEKLRGLGLSNVIFHQLEITDPSSIARLAGFLSTRFGKLDILVNNAGIVGLEYLQDRIDGASTTSEKGDLRRREGMPEDELPRHEASHRSAAAAAAGLRRWQDRQRLLRARAAQAFRRRGAEAGAGRRGAAERGEGGRGGGGVREGPGFGRRGVGGGGVGGARVARRRDVGVRGVEGGAERLLAGGGAAAPGGARQLRASGVREHRHDRQLRRAPSRGRRRPGGGRGAAPGRRAHRRLLPGPAAGALPVTTIDRCSRSLE